jgi:carbon storage regulator
MLVLTRRTRQSIMIGDEIELSVLSVSGEKVRIGIEAPSEVPVFRKEVYLRIAGERVGNSNGTGELSELEPARSGS